MILKDSGIKTEVFGGINELDFSIKEENMGLVFEMLRSKMYKNPIAAISREIASNSRDANREAGKENEPIEISIIHPDKLLNNTEPSIRFRDLGIGISPERMENVFIQYASSTKRDTNKYTGGFGLGAKTPFAYSDVFTITTVHDKIKYCYSAYIDETKKGKIRLEDQTETSESSGTTIEIPIKQQDISTFQNEILKATYFWKVRPNLNGFNSYSLKGFNSDNILLGRQHYFISRRIDHFTGHLVLIDDIAYEIDTHIVKSNLSSPYRTLLALRFKNGELNISATRESLQYDDYTKKRIQNLCKSVSDDLLKHIKDQIESCKTYIDALLKVRVMVNSTLTTTKEDEILSNTYALLSDAERNKLTEELKWKGKSLNALVYNRRFNYYKFHVIKNKSLYYTTSIDIHFKFPIYVVDDLNRIKNRIITLKSQHEDCLLIYSVPPKQLILTQKEEEDDENFKGRLDIAQKNYETALKVEASEKELLASFELVTKNVSTVIPFKITRPAITYNVIRYKENIFNKPYNLWAAESVKRDKKTKTLTDFDYIKEETIILPVNDTKGKIINEQSQTTSIGIAEFLNGLKANGRGTIIIVDKNKYEFLAPHGITLEEEIKKADVKILQKYLDSYLIDESFDSSKLEMLRLFDFGTQINNKLKKFKYINKIRAGGIVHIDELKIVNFFKERGFKFSTEVEEIVKTISDINNHYPLINHLVDLDDEDEEGIIPHVNQYIQIVNKTHTK